MKNLGLEEKAHILARKKNNFKNLIALSVTKKALEVGLDLSVEAGLSLSPEKFTFSRKNEEVESHTLNLNKFLEKHISVRKMLKLSETELENTIDNLSTCIVEEAKILLRFDESEKILNNKITSLSEINFNFNERFNHFSRLRLVVRNENEKRDCISKKIKGTDLKVFVVSVYKKDSKSMLETAFFKDRGDVINAFFENTKEESYASLGIEEKKDLLFSIALKNTKVPVGIDMPNVLFSLGQNLDTKEMKDNYSSGSVMIPFYNEDQVMGKTNAATLFIFEDKLKEIFNNLGGDFFILPSSIHEMIVVPNRERKSTRNFDQQVSDLLKMVREVNSTELAPEEFLSNSVYYFDGEKINMF